jgi:hypothetical protein
MKPFSPSRFFFREGFGCHQRFGCGPLSAHALDFLLCGFLVLRDERSAACCAPLCHLGLVALYTFSTFSSLVPSPLPYNLIHGSCESTENVRNEGIPNFQLWGYFVSWLWFCFFVPIFGKEVEREVAH